ncbi:MAG: allantoinase [Acidimicrobiia bacterium]|nr:allantoinase [Acidimicrobiia bacterium]
MAKLALIYGMRLLPADDIEAVGQADIQLANGRKAAVTMHLIEGETEKEIRGQLEKSLDAFFEIHLEP